jgi:RNA polymerase sigma-70 factor (ECF subfamily)
MLRAVEEMSVEEVAAVPRTARGDGADPLLSALRGLLREGLSRDVDLGISDAFSFAGERCDRIVAGVLEPARRGPGTSRS